jgi:hypothetical protein
MFSVRRIFAGLSLAMAILQRGVQVVKSEGMMKPPAPPTAIFVPIVLPR